MFAKRKQADLKPIEEYLPSGHSHSENAEEHQRLFDWGHPEKLLETQQLRQIIDEAIGELPFSYREAFVLRYLEEMSVKDVAKAINESEAATKSRILRARLALRDKLAAIFEEHHGK
jgi:RNA polymerase sigma-70 factor (ECF subfamily)